MNKRRIAPWISDEILKKVFLEWNVDNYIYSEGLKARWYVVPSELCIKEIWYSNVNYSSKTELGYISLHNCCNYEVYFHEFMGLTSQEYFDIMVLHIMYEEDRPRCPYCGSYLPFLSPYAGYGTADHDWKSKIESRVVGMPFCSSQCKMAYMRISDKFEYKSVMDKFYSEGGAYGYMHTHPTLYPEYHKKWLQSLRNWGTETSIGNSFTYHSNKFNRTYKGRSNLELYCIQWADSDDSVKDLEYESLSIEYTFNNKIHNYIPDFLITFTDGKKLLVEIKPYDKLNDPKNIAKWESARKYCSQVGWDFTVWTEWDV